MAVDDAMLASKVRACAAATKVPDMIFLDFSGGASRGGDRTKLQVAQSFISFPHPKAESASLLHLEVA